MQTEILKIAVPFPKINKKGKLFVFFPFENTKWDGDEAQQGASYHLGWTICSALLSSLFHRLHLSSVIIMELVDIERNLPGIDSRITEECSVQMMFASFCRQKG